MADGTFVEIKGEFTFAINQNGLDFDDEKERQLAVDDFWDCWEDFLESIEHLNHIPSFNIDRKKVKVEVGE